MSFWIVHDLPSLDRKVTAVKLTDQAVGLILDALPRMPGYYDPDQLHCLILTSVVDPIDLYPQSESSWISAR